MASTRGGGQLKAVKEVWWWERPPAKAGDLSHQPFQLRAESGFVKGCAKQF